MSFPASLTTRTVKGRFVTVPDGRPAEGCVRIVLDNFMQGPTDDAIVAPFDKTWKFVDGNVSINLPSNNDPQWTPGVYRIVLTVGEKVHRQKFDVPYNGTDPLDLSDLLNLPAVTPGESYIVLASKGAPGGVASLDSGGRLPTSQLPAGLGGAIFWDDIEDKPLTFTPSAHTHDYASITGKPSTFTPSAHTHTTSDVTGLTTTLAAKADLVAGVIPSSQIPSISVIDFLGDKASEAEMLATTGQKGDWVIRTDAGQAFIITDTDPSILDSWTAMPVGSSAVQSVNGQTGIIVLGKADIGLSDVDNTSDADKPVSTAQQAALDDKADVVHTHSTSDVTGLDTALASKASNTDLTTGLAGKANTSHTHATSDVTGLDTALSGKASTVHTHATSDVTGLDTALAGKASTVHTHSASDVTTGTLDTARGGTGMSAGFTASSYLRASSTTALEFRTASQVLSDIGAAASTHTHVTSDVSGLDTALTAKAPLASPTFTGTPAAPTATAGTNTTQIATTAFVTTADNLKAPLASPALTGTPTAPTASAGTSTTQLATTAFVGTAISNNGPKVLVLSAGAAVPGGTASGTVIVRTST